MIGNFSETTGKTDDKFLGPATSVLQFLATEEKRILTDKNGKDELQE